MSDSDCSSDPPSSEADSDFKDDGENSPAPAARGKGGSGKAPAAKKAAGAPAGAAAKKKATLSATTSHNAGGASEFSGGGGGGGGACGGAMEGIDEEDGDEDGDSRAAAAAPQKSRPAATNNNKGRKVEDVYKKLSQLEHILLRPDTYIGSTEKQTATLWVFDGDSLSSAGAGAGASSSASAAAQGGPRLTLRQVTYAPGLYKIFDEILVNAADHKVRDARMDTLRVNIDASAGRIVVENNGGGIPVEMHKDEGVYVPELIFGHLLTSSNYDDGEKKVTGGRNGYGAKLANIFSSEFVVETADGARSGLRYRQVFRANMSSRSAPELAPCPRQENWTRIAFAPDLPKFDMREGEPLEADTVALMKKRVLDVAGVLGRGVKVVLNGERVPVRSFAEYVDLYLGPAPGKGGAADGAGAAGAAAAAVPRVIERVGARWEVCVAATEGQFQQVSFVNGVCTIKGGTHVNAVVDQVCKFLVERLNKKHKAANVKPFMVKNHLWVFINAAIENPAFDSQTKETLTTRAGAFGSRVDLAPAFLERVSKCGLLDNVLSFADFKNQKQLTKSDGAKKSRLVGITKLSDANEAGTRASGGCTLILTEGDSAKSLAMAGLSVVGHDRYGVFPLRGKLLNVRDATAQQVSDNAEINHIKRILGLQHGKIYTDERTLQTLRYGSLMIMTDQDHDGSHIKGLIMNFLHTFYPSLLRVPGFLVEFITPIVKARPTRGGGGGGGGGGRGAAAAAARAKVFYTMPEYEAWVDSLPAPGLAAGWDVKYYKGLGTSSSAEAKEYFSRMDSHRKEFVWDDDADGEAIEMAFSKKRVDDRKRWLSSFVPGTYLDQSAGAISYRDFVHKELILFSRADLERSIPSAVDGLKPGQRKILFACFKRNLRRDIKVAQLAGYVSEHSAYHHGEASLQQTIVGLAQDFVGSNNVNLLVPSGQFGTRLQGGKDAASPRYIYTRLAPLARHLFHKADDKLLRYLCEEGQSIEPEHYVPLLPTVLVNGAEGIGTGWSTFVPNYSPRDIVANLKRLLNGEPMVAMQPWYRGFHGSVVEVPAPAGSARGARSFLLSGTASASGPDRLEVTELPVRRWTQDYKEFLESLIEGYVPAAGADKGKGAKGAAGGGGKGGGGGGKGGGAAAGKKAAAAAAAPAAAAGAKKPAPPAKKKAPAKKKKGSSDDGGGGDSDDSWNSGAGGDGAGDDEEDDDDDDEEFEAATAGARGGRGRSKASGAADAAPPLASGPLLLDYKEHHTDLSVHFSCEMLPGKLDEVLRAGIEQRLKLTTRVSTGNMMLFDADGKIRRYETPEQILAEFFDLRLATYERRRRSLLHDAEWAERRAGNKSRFVAAVISGALAVGNRKRAAIEGDLDAAGFARMTKSRPGAEGGSPDALAAAAALAGGEDGGGGSGALAAAAGGAVGDPDADAAADEAAAAAAAAAAATASYDYLLSMPIWSLTQEKVELLRAEAEAAAAEVGRLRGADIRRMWLDDLDAFSEAYEAWEAEEQASQARLARQQLAAREGRGGAKKGGGKKKKGGAAAGGKKKKAAGSDDDDDDEEEDDGDDGSDFEAEVLPKKARGAPGARGGGAAASRASSALAAGAAASARPPAAAPAAPKPPAAAGKKGAAPAGAAALSGAPAARPAYTAKAAAAPRPGAAPAPVAAAALKAEEPEEPEEEPEPLSLVERLRMMAMKHGGAGAGAGAGGGGGAAAGGGLSAGAVAGSGGFGGGAASASAAAVAAAAGPSAAPAPKRSAASAAASKMRGLGVHDEEEEDEEDGGAGEVMSPPPARGGGAKGVGGAKGGGGGNKGKGPAAAAFGRSSVGGVSPEVAARRAAAEDQRRAAVKRKPAGGRKAAAAPAASDDDDDEGCGGGDWQTSPAPAAARPRGGGAGGARDPYAYDAATPSPAVARKKQQRLTAASPAPAGAAAAARIPAAARPPKPPAAAAKPAAAAPAAAAAAPAAAAAAAAAGRARRAAPAKKYADSDGEEDDEEASSAPAGSSSEYEASE